MCRRAWCLVLAGVLFLSFAASASAQSFVPAPSKEKTTAADCALGASLLCAGEDLVDGVVDAAGDAIGAGVEAAGGAVFDGLTSWVGEGAAWLVRSIGGQIERSTRPELGSAWFGRHYATSAQIAIALSIVFVLLAVLHAIVRQNAAMLLRSVFVALPLALLMTFCAITLVEAALAVTDWMTKAALGGTRRDSNEAFSDLAEILVPATAAGSPVPGFLLFLSAVVTSLLALVVWLELIMREAAIYVAGGFLPLTFVAMVWGKTAHWAPKLVGWLAAIIVSKFTIATAFALAAGAMGNARGGGTGGLSALMGGCAVLVIAAATPWVILSIIPFGDGSGGRGLDRGSIRQAGGALPGAAVTTMVVRQAAVGGMAGAAGGGRRAQAGSAGSAGGVGKGSHVATPTPVSAPSSSNERYASLASTSLSGGTQPARDRSREAS